MKVSLEDVLEARDRRQKKRRELALKYRLPVVVLTLNIPGETKRGEIPDYIFKAGVEAISRELLEETAEFSVVDAPTGNEAFFVARAADAAQLKKRLRCIFHFVRCSYIFSSSFHLSFFFLIQ